MSGERRDHGEQEISIRRHKSELFVPEETGPTGPVRPFSEVLRETPPAPPPMWLKAALWAVAVVAALLFAAALWRIVERPKPTVPRRTRPRSSKSRSSRKRPNAAARFAAPPIIADLAPIPTDQEPRG